MLQFIRYASQQSIVMEILSNNSRLKEFNPHTNRATIEHKSSTLEVDTVFLEDTSFKQNSLYQFIGKIPFPHCSFAIGEIERNGFDFVLKARVVRNVDGMDVNLYEKALKLRYLKILVT